MQFFECEEPINARSSTVWNIITDAGNFTVWESGITWVDGEVRKYEVWSRRWPRHTIGVDATGQGTPGHARRGNHTMFQRCRQGCRP